MKTLTLKLQGASPDSIQISELGDYLKKLSALYGKADVLYLDSVEEGCACLNVKIDDDHAGSAEQHVLEASLGRGAKKYLNAYKSILRLMTRDNYEGEILIDDKKVVTLPVQRKQTDPLLEQRMQTSVKGKVFRVGGTDDTVPVKIKSADGEVVNGETSIDISMELGAHLYQHIHAHGEGLWISERPGKWRLSKLTIDRYEVIEDVSAAQALMRLKAIGGIKQEEGERIHADILEQRG